MTSPESNLRSWHALLISSTNSSLSPSAQGCILSSKNLSSVIVDCLDRVFELGPAFTIGVSLLYQEKTRYNLLLAKNFTADTSAQIWVSYETSNISSKSVRCQLFFLQWKKYSSINSKMRRHKRWFSINRRRSFESIYFFIIDFLLLCSYRCWNKS